jgi:hypothetical protein
MEAQRTWRKELPPNPSSNFTDFHGFKDTPNRFENRFHHSFIIRVHPEIRGSISVFGLKRRKFAAKKSLGQF